MTTNIVVPDREGHWYTLDGQPAYTVPNKSKPGEFRNTTVRDARDLHLVPSVTGITGVIRKPALESWIATQYVLSALTLPQNPGESQDAFAQRVIRDARIEGQNAADFGTQVHTLADMYLHNRLPDRLSHVDYSFLQGIMDWCTVHHVEVMETELAFACLDDMPYGYGGRLDFMGVVNKAVPLTCDCGCINWPMDQMFVVADWKTQRSTPGKMFNFYADWNPQLKAYSHGVHEENAPGLSVVVSSTEPGRVESCFWPADDWGWDAFLAMKKIYYSPLGQGYALVGAA